ncbi:hypothetical protein Amir_2303 [Actinosynnema mirum DSM 43827]|uniref:Uncharacterized protein n=1 Tax=Actinosynnema mirum (strain ATCC 29888 / DSM 43827 / JCM 3225 / NBRC 14064 / NCIMB 13271 / NRRL B-12336 / IMRU 3971 / 101) TaxID=446462 RepID=C6WJL8_ACTMD|nr:hypothetical protein Amir_2303 [Actinosynnema mirum DSM 43827]
MSALLIKLPLPPEQLPPEPLSPEPLSPEAGA